MCKKNLFEDMTSGEMRQRLQEVSEYMDEVINERRKKLRQRNLKRDDLPADPMWNLAHDVLEIIHCLEVDKPSSVGSLAVKIEVDTSELDEAIGKAERLAELISENMFEPVELYGWNKRDLILGLVNNYGWSYADACNFAENYWQEVAVEQVLKRVAIVRDALIDCDGYRGNTEALELLIEEAEEALTKILNGEEPYGVMAALISQERECKARAKR